MLKQLRATIVCFLLMTLLVGAVYPLVVTVIAQAVFPARANGSLIEVNQKTVGSRLLGQEFADPKYFWGRLSATSLSAGTALPSGVNVPDGMSVAIPYDYMYSGGSNLGPTNAGLVSEVQGRIDALHAADPAGTGSISHGLAGEMVPFPFSAGIPVDLVTSSGSGLDPHISPGAAEYQVARVARARGMDVARVRVLVGRFTEGRQLGILGEPRVNVLELNLALDREHR